MNLRQIGAWGAQHPSGNEAVQLPNADRSLTLLIEGAALGMPEIDGAEYSVFRQRMGQLALQTPDRLPEHEKLAAIREILREFENYRKAGENTLRERTAAWRAITGDLLSELLARLGISPTKPAAASLLNRIPGLLTTGELSEFASALADFLHPTDAHGNAQDILSPLNRTDHTTVNLNAAGLRGGGSAVEHLERILSSGRGSVVIFRLSCLGMIFERFGAEAVEDCLMAISAYLTHSLHSDDAIYHWSDSSLLAILQGRANEQILAAELNRIAAQNRDITIQIGGRTIMLRVPLAFDIHPVSSFRCADDLLKLSPGVRREMKP